jgi:hypothetical protein
MAEVDVDAALPTGQSRNPMEAETYLDWLRSDRGPAGAVTARNTVEQNRPYQIDHYEVNQMWGELPIVVEGRETGAVYEAAHDDEKVAPYAGETAMIDDLGGNLAPLEMVLAMQYLYAYFSLADPDAVDETLWPTLKDDLIFARRAIVGVAIGEMTHLRWANQMLWVLQGPDNYHPVLEPAETIRVGAGPKKTYPRTLAPLSIDLLDRFIEIERPGGFIDQAYARCVATMRDRDTYPAHLYELAVRIDTDGDEHFLRFSQMKEILSKYPDGPDGPPYLRPLQPANGTQAERAMATFGEILAGLEAGYTTEAHGDFAAAQENIAAVRENMHTFLDQAETLAAKGIGVPFWSDSSG